MNMFTYTILQEHTYDDDRSSDIMIMAKLRFRLNILIM